MKLRLLKYLTADWPRKIASLSWAIVLYQILAWLSELTVNGYYLLDETRWVIRGSLATCTAIVLLLPRPAWLRETLQVAGVLLLTLWVLDYEYIWLEGYPVLDNLEMNVSQATPFIWYGLGAWFLLSFITEWGRTKARVLSLVILLIVFFSVYDSYSTIYLWQEVAYVVFAGLLLLVTLHYSQFRDKHPQSWQHLKEYPGAVLVPVVLVVALSITAGTLAPSIRPLMTDPYTAWKSWKGETVNKIGKSYAGIDVGGVQRNASSGYGRDDSVLGGGFNYDFSPVMRVSTNRSSYWRGETRNVYTGEGWIENESERATNGVSPETFMPEFPGFDDSRLETVEIRQTVTMIEEESYPVLFGAYRMKQVTALESGDYSPLRWSGEGAELFWNERVPYPRTYSIVSEMPVIDEEGLKQTSSTLPNAVRQQYVQLPDTLPDRVRELAEQITAGAGSDYEKAKLIETYLRENYVYTNEPDLSKVDSEDFVDGFLFELQEGYCDYYSTAMAVLLRSIDIPTRWVKGFATGTLPIEQMQLDILLERFNDYGGEGIYTVVNADAHSWVEVYFEGYGWIPFEPTSVFTMPTAVPVDETVAEPLELGDADAGTEPEEEPERSNWQATIGWASAAVALLAGIVALVWLRPQWLRKLRLPVRKPVESYNHKVVLEYERFVRYAKRKGYPIEPSQTAREMLDGWLKYNSGARTDFNRLVALFEKAKYSNQAIRKEEYEAGTEIAERLKKAM